VFTPLARVYYARALAALGKTDESRTAYEQFFDNWKKADPDLPLLVTARQEYAELTGSSGQPGGARVRDRAKRPRP